MKSEVSRQPELMWSFWFIPKDLSRDEAIKYFMEKIKPRTYTFEKFTYDRKAGRVGTA